MYWKNFMMWKKKSKILIINKLYIKNVVLLFAVQKKKKKKKHKVKIQKFWGLKTEE